MAGVLLASPSISGWRRLQSAEVAANAGAPLAQPFEIPACWRVDALHPFDVELQGCEPVFEGVAAGTLQPAQVTRRQTTAEGDPITIAVGNDGDFRHA